MSWRGVCEKAFSSSFGIVEVGLVDVGSFLKVPKKQKSKVLEMGLVFS